MNNDPKQSAQPCGCDQGCRYVCAQHSKWPVEEWQGDIIYGKTPGECKQGVLADAVRPSTAAIQALAVGPGDVVNVLAEAQKQAYEGGPDVGSKTWRKQRPLYSGVLAYFPDALMEVAHVSFLGNAQHNPGEPLHWAREKSTDHLDCIARHITDHAKNPVDDDGALHLAKAAWRALAELQTYLENGRMQ